MLQEIARASHQVPDPPDQERLSVTYQRRTGEAGRPRQEFDTQFLTYALQERGPAGIARFFGCSARTVRRRSLEYGLLSRGNCPFQEIVQDNQPARVRVGAVSHTRLSTITEEELDGEVAEVLQNFPGYGRRMVHGHLRAQGILTSLNRTVNSIARVRGLPAFLRRPPIQRRTYFVPGPNSLWHHDGQHGLLLSCRLPHISNS
jgi:hypothetical protein